MSLCKLFITNNLNTITYSFAKHCRDNDFLCGKDGWFFDDINKKLEIKYVNLLTNNQINIIESNTNGFFNYSDKDEKESYDNYVNNITKLNIKNTYKKKDIQKLFKKIKF